ncbi:MAG TPA: DUF6077 domain-containing protein, partial [Rubrobacter sp.]|nr:DUF6077 domain-containing protein [Rubrobacter sp.]
LQVPAFAATLALFMVPGLLLARLALGTCVAGVARLPVAFVMSAGVFGLAAVPMLLLHGSLTAYLVLCGFLLAASLLGWAIYHATTSPSGGAGTGRVFELPEPILPNLLWVPFLGLSGVLAYKTAVRVQRPFDDGWVYLGHVREYLVEDRLGGEGFSRISVDGWLVVQAAMSRVSGVEPVGLVLEFLAPTLCVVALLALYALGRVLFESETAALLTGTLAALLLLVNPGVPLLAPGGEFVARISEDKYAVRFIFLPVMLIAATLFSKERRPRYLGLFAFVCLASTSAHPIGLALAAIAVGSFGIVHLAVERGRSAWRGVGGLAAVLLGILGPPAVYLLATGSPILSRLRSARPDTSSSILNYWQREEQLLEVWNGAYIVHPSLILNPVVVAVYVVGVPFLVWRLKKSLAARLLLGILVLAPVSIFVPFIARPLGEVIGPWVLIRFSWPLTLAAMLTLGWVCHAALAYTGSRLERSGPAMLRSGAPLLPLVLVCILAIPSVGPALAGLRSTDRRGETAQAEVSCHDPVFAWMGAEITAPGRVLAPEEEDSCIPAYSSAVETLGSRDGITRRSRGELDHFYNASVVDGEMVRTLVERRIDYVLLRANSPLTGQLEHLPGFAAMNNPGERYRLYSVDRGELGITPVVASNSRLAENDPEGAMEGYTRVLEDPRSTGDDRFLAYTGLGRAYEQQGLLAEAAYSYEEASALDP